MGVNIADDKGCPPISDESCQMIKYEKDIVDDKRCPDNTRFPSVYKKEKLSASLFSHKTLSRPISPEKLSSAYLTVRTPEVGAFLCRWVLLFGRYVPLTKNRYFILFLMMRNPISKPSPPTPTTITI
ncbi:hypothetical protein CEXT_571161 [Caerostris extrusa]|uniref:Uncharacterized protein n=1 Tax=Caerostris extrusa TaxID=172846 RepID=A0AAV4RVZ4_CAEEX|nr:hypothetical protein CEXT_571161 [Caerostris extrusa]